MSRGGKLSLVKWLIPPEILRIIGHVLVGGLAGVLCVFTLLYSLGVFRTKKPLNLDAPRLMPSHQASPIPTYTPVPEVTSDQFKLFFPTYTPTPAPKATYTLEELERERMRWDLEHGIIETAVGTGKKKKKRDRADYIDKHGVLQDGNQDGLLEFSIAMLFKPGDKSEQAVVFTSFVHICCGCALTHRVYINIYNGPFGFRMWQRWEVLDHETHVNRVRKWGMNYRRQNDFLNQPHILDLDPINGYSAAR